MRLRKLEDCYQIDTVTNCWIWLKSKTPTGYGKLQWLGKLQYAHRVMYEKYVKPIPAGMEINHKCKNRSCVNPEHLEIVTPQHNRKERSTTKLSYKIVEEIRANVFAIPKSRAAGIENEKLAQKYGVNIATIRSVLRDASWR